eukprot:gene2923-8170_t
MSLIPVGPGCITINAVEPMDVYTFRPICFSCGPLVVVFHGVARNAKDYRNFSIHIAERFGAVVAVPHFDKKRFPYSRYQQGGILKEGEITSRDQWSFSRVPIVVQTLISSLGKPDRQFFFIGHSAGGQFLVRLTAVAGSLGAERVVVANSGSHLFPTRNARYCYGFGGLPREFSSDQAIRRYLAAPLTLYLGTADNNPYHRALDRRPAALAQGPHRYARGRACFEAALTLATEKGWVLNWKVVETPGIGHDALRMFSAPEIADVFSHEWLYSTFCSQQITANIKTPDSLSPIPPVMSLNFPDSALSTMSEHSLKSNSKFPEQNDRVVCNCKIWSESLKHGHQVSSSIMCAPSAKYIESSKKNSETNKRCASQSKK